MVNLDSLYPLENWPDVFREKRIFIRVDPGTGRGHHQHVKTAGKQSKFGIPSEDVHRVVELVNEIGATVIGLHAHTGSGILTEADNWVWVADFLLRWVPAVHPIFCIYSYPWHVPVLIFFCQYPFEVFNNTFPN
eukprot:TRINITY_DN5055_c0_g1_i18.p1 TRINITY_DN5055_c0_g1~~TRINITY_DN5055_c0_g1_i18.p1  ORF type:complete len:134 (-),score=15.04 TRINITY_DN5055_c0_g1_i18:723-1124(-)